jgi:hypothetical protein
MSLTQAEIDDGPQSGAALPSHWYVDDGVLEREFELIFERSWQCVGMTHELASSGDFITGQVGRIPVVVIRDQRGAPRGYVNLFLHRCSLSSRTGPAMPIACAAPTTPSSEACDRDACPADTLWPIPSTSWPTSTAWSRRRSEITRYPELLRRFR